jgi:hypothetical protein
MTATPTTTSVDSVGIPASIAKCEVIGIRMADPVVGADPLDDLSVRAPDDFPVAHVMIRGAVDGAASDATPLGVNADGDDADHRAPHRVGGMDQPGVIPARFVSPEEWLAHLAFGVDRKVA